MAFKYKHRCECGGRLFLISFQGSCHLMISPDGFSLIDGPIDTQDEEVQCGKCDTVSDLESFWVDEPTVEEEEVA